MLVVIAIIGIIAAIALPAIGRAKIRSKAAVTKVEMKSLEGQLKPIKAITSVFQLADYRIITPEIIMVIIRLVNILITLMI